MSLLLVAALVAPSLSVPFLGSPVDRPMYRCLAGWELLEDTCFLISNNSGSWYEGQDFCNTHGATLATISSDFQQAALSNMLTESTWIGLNDLKEDHKHGWADGSEYNYASWESGEPNNSGDILWLFGEREDCVEMRKKYDFQWNDEQCYHTRQFLCSAPAKRVLQCDEGWKLYESSCYQISDSKASWWDAQTTCNNQYAYLATITSEGEQNFLAGLLQQNTWIGLSDEDGTRTYTWEDGNNLSYTNWKDGEPNNFYSVGGFGLNEDCVEMRQENGYQWNDKFCRTRNAYICEKPAH